MKWKWLAGISVLALGVMAGCGTFEVQVEPLPSPEGVDIVNDLPAEGTDAAAPSTLGTTPEPADATNASEPAADADAETSEPGAEVDEPAPEPVRTHRLQGLLFGTADGVYEVNGAGEAVLVASEGFGIPSPDGRYLGVLEYAEPNSTVRIVDRETGSDVALVNDKGRVCCLSWWPGRPGVLLYGALPADAEIGPGTSGNLAALDVDGTDYGVLDPDNDLGPWGIAPSPDGVSVAYGFGETGRIYRWGEGVSVLDPREFTYNWGKSIKMGSPSWSPDGSKIAYVLSSPPDGVYETSVVVFDLATRVATKVYGYEPAGRGGWPAPPTWSPDGQWLAFEVWAQDMSADGIWVGRADGSEAFPVSDGASPVWSPAGDYVAFLHSADRQLPPGIWVAEVGTWSVEETGLAQAVARLIGWQ